ncbi:MAG: fibronectin type III domain-containing protein [Clostridia bacterium]|nr:fibronectin type III domain-containing protein [Clostridia bacterium]
MKGQPRIVMKKHRRLTAKITVLILSAVLLFGSVPVNVFAATGFEQSISAFPESYKVKLRALHEKYPKWTFTAMNTGLDWQTAVEKECEDDRNLVEEYCSSYIYKSHASGDFNSSTGKYIYKDGGFVTASEIAVAQFMDPRNSLTASTIFQFEDLKFSSSCTVDTIESILYGSFMYDTVITYYTSAGKKVSDTVTYSQAIYNAGKKNNINPCFLASKILSEVGSSGSSAVSGKYSGYEGIYNFYNIGATDGSGAIGRGLKWARTGSTYSRPWNTPVRSIEGGAEFLSAQYVAEGQYTGYLQKFQVNPKSGYELYNHQYMTNVSGAYMQGYLTYQAYLSCSVLNSAHSFVIPVYKNMPGEKTPSPVLNIADTIRQTGKTNKTVSMRTGPSESYSRVNVSVPSGSTVTIFSKERTDASYYLSLLKYPYWYKVQYTVNKKTYTGYIYSGYVEEASTTVVKTGSYTLNCFASVSGHDDSLKIVSSDTSVASVSGKKLTVKKTGTATLTAYSPCGGFDTMKITASSSGSRKISSLNVKDRTTSSVTLSWKAADKANAYNICVIDTGGRRVKSINTSSDEYTVTALSSTAKYNMFVRSYTSSSSVKTYGVFSAVKAVTTPAKVVGAKARQGDKGLELSWTAVGNADGYEISTVTAGKYTVVAKTEDTTFSVAKKTINDASVYRVRAYITYDTAVYGAYSGKFSVDYSPMQVDKLSQKDTTAAGYTLTWKKAGGAAGYLVYAADKDGKYSLICDTKNNSYIVDEVSFGEKILYKVKGYSVTPDGVKLYANASAPFTAVTLPGKIGKITSSTDDGKIKLKWNAVKNCDGYKICTVESDGAYTVIADTDKTEYTLPQFEGKRVFSVCAYSAGSVGDLCSAYSNKCTVAYKVDKPSSIKAEALDNGMRITWSKCKDVSGYSVELYSEDMGIYIPMLDTKGTSYTVFGIKSGKFRVRAYMKLSGGTKYSGYKTVSAKSK